jgi:hypothetical protein
MKRAKPPPAISVEDEPGMAERFQHGLRRAFATPHKPLTPKPKQRPASKGRVHKSKIRG